MPPLRQTRQQENWRIEGFLRFLSGSRGSREPLAAPTRAHRPSGAVIRRRCGRPQAVHRPRRPHSGPLTAFQPLGGSLGVPPATPVNADSRHRWLRIDRAATARSPAY